MQVSSIAISQPLDVIKVGTNERTRSFPLAEARLTWPLATLARSQTRIQNQNFENKLSGSTVIREIIKNEGVGAFFKGLTPKVLSVHNGSFVAAAKMES